MPIYEYQCPKCGTKEVWEKVSDNPDGKPVKCDTPGCKQKMSRVISATSFHLKGSGWYKTDYASGSGSSTTKPTSGSKAKEESKSDKGESKKSTKSGCGSGCACH